MFLGYYIVLKGQLIACISVSLRIIDVSLRLFAYNYRIIIVHQLSFFAFQPRLLSSSSGSETRMSTEELPADGTDGAEKESGGFSSEMALLKKQIWQQQKANPETISDLSEPPLKTEIRMYQNMDHIKKTYSGDDVLNWWKANEEKLPLLAGLARSILGVPVTSAPSERLFSTAGNNMTFSR